MGIQMAKASETDMKLAMDLGGVLDVLGHRHCPCMPEAIELLGTGEDSEPFDRDDDSQCGRVLAPTEI